MVVLFCVTFLFPSLASYGGLSARKALKVVSHVEYVVAIELLAACQAIELMRPLKTSAPLEEVIKLVRSKVKPWTEDRFMSPDIETATQIVRDGEIWNVVKHHIQTQYHSLPQLQTHKEHLDNNQFGDEQI